MKKGEIFWGILLLTLGVLFLFRNLDIFDFSFGSLLRLWPLIFVFWGISMLPVKQGIKFLLVGLTIVLGIIILNFAPHHDNHWFEWRTEKYYDDWEDEEEVFDQDDEDASGSQDFSELYDSVVTSAKLKLDAAAGKFYFTNPTSKLFELKNEGDADPYKISTTLNDSNAIIYVRHKNKVHSRDLKNSARLALNPGPVWNLDINVGAAELDIDVIPYKIEQIDIDGGASKIDLKIGSGCKYTRVNIDAGASGITIQVPYESACELHTNTVLSSRDIDGFNKISGGLYQTPNFTDSVNQIIIEIDAAVSSLEVKRIQKGF